MHENNAGSNKNQNQENFTQSRDVSLILILTLKTEEYAHEGQIQSSKPGEQNVHRLRLESVVDLQWLSWEEEGCQLREAWFVRWAHTRCWEHVKGFDKCFKGNGKLSVVDWMICSDSSPPCARALCQVTLSCPHTLSLGSAIWLALEWCRNKEVSVSEARPQEASHAPCWALKLLSTPCKMSPGQPPGRSRWWKVQRLDLCELSIPSRAALEKTPPREDPPNPHWCIVKHLICTYLRQIARVSRIHPNKPCLGQLPATDVQTAKFYPPMLRYWGLEGFQHSAVANTKGYESRQVQTCCTFERLFLMQYHK